MTRFFYDTEFLENGHSIGLISIGIIADDGREYYAVNQDAPWALVYEHEWLMANVVPSLPLRPDWAKPTVNLRHQDVKRHRVIADEVREFLLASGGSPELWADYAAYDHVALCQLWGRMIDLPDGIPMWTNDIQQERRRIGNVALPKQESGVHNALADARHNKVQFDFLRDFPVSPGEETSRA